jgi:hypothetical protein
VVLAEGEAIERGDVEAVDASEDAPDGPVPHAD